MAEPTAPPPEPVKAFDRLGNKIELPASDVPALVKMGGRVATPQELAEVKAEADYAKKSTTEKVTSALSYAGPIPFAARMLATGEAPTLPPVAESYVQGVGNTFGAGLPQLAIKEATAAVGSETASRQYRDRATLATEANPGANTVGQVVGFGVGMLAGGSSALGATAKAGAVVEQGVGRALAGVASRGAVGQAVTTGAKMGARGALESAMLAGTTHLTGEAFQDHEIHGEKLYAAMGNAALVGGGLGAVLGFGGSLALSGAKATLASAKEAATSRISKLAGEGEGALAEAGKLMPGRGQMETSARKAASNLAVDALGATQVQQNKALQTLGAKGREELGEWLTRNVPTLARKEGETVADAAVRAFKGGRADDLLEQIQPLKAAKGAAIGDLVKATPTKVQSTDLIGQALAIEKEMLADPTRIAGAKAFGERVRSTFEAFTNGGKVAADGTMDLSEMYYARAGLEKQAFELGKGSSAHGAFKDWLRKVDDTLVTKLDEAATAAGKSGQRDAILAAKKEYQFAATAEKLADQGAKRVAGNNIFGLREGIGMAVGLATGSAVGGLAAGIGGKLARERGAAVGAALLGAAVDRGAIAKTLEAMDALVVRSARGALRETPRLPSAAPATAVAVRATAYRGKQPAEAVATAKDVREQARAIVKWSGEVRANPAATLDRVQRASEDVSRTAGPRAAAGFTQTTMKALAFVAANVPAKERRDPLDPRSVPPMTTEESERMVRVAKYATRPASVFEDFERGKVTPEGLAAAQEFMPEQLQAFRQELLSHVTELMSRDQRLTATQRLRIDKLLGGVPAGPDLRPENLARLQANFAPVPPEPQGAAAPPPTRGKSVDMPVQETGFDAVEKRKSGS